MHHMLLAGHIKSTDGPWVVHLCYRAQAATDRRFVGFILIKIWMLTEFSIIFYLLAYRWHSSYRVSEETPLQNVI